MTLESIRQQAQTIIEIIYTTKENKQILQILQNIKTRIEEERKRCFTE